MSRFHLILTGLVVAIWGSNFVVIKWVLGYLPPILFAALRFTLAFLPAALLVPRPKVGWGVLAGYGLAIGVGQFGLLFLAMRASIPPGLASLVVQMQVFFTLGLAVYWRGEQVKRMQWLACVVAALGLMVIAWHTDATTTPLGLLLVLGAALSWGLGNIISQTAKGVNIFGFVIWSSGFSVPPLLMLSWLFEGGIHWEVIATQWTLPLTLALLWQSWGNTLFGYGVWAWLLVRYPASMVVPWAFTIPLFGMGASYWWLNEPMPLWKWGAASLILLGLVMNDGAQRGWINFLYKSKR